jgi:hypothetical protein
MLATNFVALIKVYNFPAMKVDLSKEELEKI